MTVAYWIVAALLALFYLYSGISRCCGPQISCGR